MDTTKCKSIHITNKTNRNKDEPNINFMWEKENFEDTKVVIRRTDNTMATRYQRCNQKP